MKAPLFEYPSFQYEVDDWDFKKKGLLNRINKQQFIRTQLQTFETDRQTDVNKKWVHYLSEFLKPELSKFCEEAEISCSMTDAWCVKYHKGDYQSVHNHRGWGFSGTLFVQFDPEVHLPPCYVAPWQDPRNDTTHLSFPNNIVEGSLFIFPSFSHHYVHPVQTKKVRTVISFDLLPNPAVHQSINKE